MFHTHMLPVEREIQGEFCRIPSRIKINHKDDANNIDFA